MLLIILITYLVYNLRQHVSIVPPGLQFSAIQKMRFYHQAYNLCQHVSIVPPGLHVNAIQKMRFIIRLRFLYIPVCHL